ncbi:IS30 family transposase [Lactobacillus crispatus]|uniref:IS30 family transposase n=1 Tax=Lactobacillus crispatus TaxID=47770 RepID=UPI003F6E15D9
MVKGVRRKNQPALMTLTERTTRFEVVIKIPDYRASTCQRLLQKEIDRHPAWFKSITFDNGSEFADMTKIKGCQIYFAHPYSPWERGTNENCNGLLRQFFPKGKSMKDKSKAYVQQATDAINHKYRRILQYHTAEELFKQYISS